MLRASAIKLKSTIMERVRIVLKHDDFIKLRDVDRKYDANIAKFVEYLDTIPWNYYITGSTAYELSLKSTRRLAQRFHYFLPSGTLFFWVAERFEVRDGHHLHGLIKLPLKNTQLDAFRETETNNPMLFEHIICQWQRACGNRLNKETDYKKWLTWHQIYLETYLKGVGAHGYCAKYINKKRSDYDLLI